MARAHRPPSDHLSYFARAAQQLCRLGPLALLRGAEARAPGLPRIGEAKLPAQDIATLTHTPSLAFPAATLDAIRVEDGRATVAGQWMGLTGPMGPLPLHLSEFAAYEQRYSRTQPYGGFLDVLAGRMLQLFYRAWASTSPAASADRPADDRFADRIAALTGAQDGARADSAFPPAARLRHAALFVSPRSPAGLQDALADLLRVPVRIREFVPRWRAVEPEDATRLGGRCAGLGQDALAGGRVRTWQDVFRVELTIRDPRDHAAFLPGGQRYALLVAALDAFAPPHLEWDVELAVAIEAIRPARLGGGARLGWSGWTGRAAPGGIRADARLGPSARRLARTLSKETIT
ncbi:type VI secretion system protein ImpH [Sphingomonas trueperi]|uniref:type VI secretion system baseplate subunit TssG n=1 Tax=Sphingomonas trueperi TaxID=53317 RepID=UPI003390A6D2